MLNDRELEMVTKIARVELEERLADDLEDLISNKVELVEEEFEARKLEKEEERMNFLRILLGETRRNCYLDGSGQCPEMEKLIEEEDLDRFFEGQEEKRKYWA